MTTRERERIRTRHRPTPLERGYGAGHRQLRKRWASAVADGGVRCARGADCKHAENGIGGLIFPGSRWDLGHHDIDRSVYNGPEHAECNRATTGRRARRTVVSRQW